MRNGTTIPILAILLIVLISTGCSGNPATGRTTSHLMINYTAENGGSLFPCGCRIPLGGLSRRGAIINSESPYTQFTVDAGSFSGGNTGYDRFTAGWILRSYVLIGYDVVNLGIRETVIPISQLREWDGITQGMLISANLHDEYDLPVTRPSLVREVDGIKIGVTGITSEGLHPSGATEIPIVIDPVAPLLEVLSEFDEEDVDLVILLADMQDDDLHNVLSQVPGFDLVIQGRDFKAGDPATATVLADGARIVKIGGFGKYLGRIRLDLNEQIEIVRDEVIQVSIETSLPAMSEITELLTQFRIELREKRVEFLGDPSNPFQRSQSPEMVDILSGYTGQGFCVSCHRVYGFEPEVTRHSTAWNILDDENKTNPDCLQCHTTGYGVPTGMDDPFRDSHLQGVTCEACHGPAAEHVRERTSIDKEIDPSSMIPYVDSTGIPFSREVPAEVCLACHTEEWSPEFDYDTWVERVRHDTSRESIQIIDDETSWSFFIERPEDENVQGSDPD